MDAEVLLAMNRRYLTRSSRHLYGIRFRSVHRRDPENIDWFTFVFGRKPALGELEIMESREPGDHRLTGFQAFELLMGTISARGTPRLQLYDRRLCLSQLLPFIVEYVGYRLQFHPYAERFLTGVSRNLTALCPNFDQLRAARTGTALPEAEWSSYMWVATLGSSQERLHREWESDTGVWLPVFVGRDRPAHAPNPVPILSRGPNGEAGQSPRAVLASWDPWADAAASVRRFGTLPAPEPEPEAGPSSVVEELSSSSSTGSSSSGSSPSARPQP